MPDLIKVIKDSNLLRTRVTSSPRRCESEETLLVHLYLPGLLHLLVPGQSPLLVNDLVVQGLPDFLEVNSLLSDQFLADDLKSP